MLGVAEWPVWANFARQGLVAVPKEARTGPTAHRNKQKQHYQNTTQHTGVNITHHVSQSFHSKQRRSRGPDGPRL